jgi:GAF domain-containing protein/HAMP domain-containing protein
MYSVLRKISIRYRLMWAFIAMLGLLIGLLAVGLISYRGIFVRLDETVNNENPVERMLLTATLNINRSRVDLLLFTSGDEYRLAVARQEINEAIQLLQKVRSAVPVSTELTEFNTTVSAVTAYQKAVEQIILANHDASSVYDASLADALSLGAEAEQHIESIRGRYVAGLIADNRNILQRSQANLSIFGILGLFFLLFSGTTLFVISNSIIRQINEVTQKMNEMNAGQQAGASAVQRLDEMRLLSRAANNLNGLITQLKEDLSKQDEMRKEIKSETASQLGLLTEVARQVSNVGNLNAVLNPIANMVLERLDLYFVGIYLVDQDAHYVILRAGTGKAGSFRLQQGYRIKVGEISLVGSVAKTGEPRLLNDVEMDYVFRRDSLLPETRSEAVFPMKIDQDVVGVFDVHCTRKNGFDADTLVLLQTVVDQLAVAVQNEYLVGELQRSAREASQLYQRYTRETWSQRTSSRNTGGYQYNLLEVEPMEQVLPSETMAKLRMGESVTVSSTEIDSNRSEHSTVMIPLTMFNQLVGVVGLENEDPNYHWSEEEISIIEAVTNQVVLAIDNARLLDEAQRRSDQLRILQEVTSVAASNTNYIELLDNVAQIIRARFHLTHCGVLTFDSPHQVATLVVNAAFDPFSPGSNVLGTKVSLQDNPIIQEMMEFHHSVLVTDVQHNPKSLSFHEMMSLRQSVSVMMAPLISRNEIIGAILFETADASRRFTKDDLDLLDQISLQISSAVDVARSFEETARRGERQRLLAEVTSRIRETLDVQSIMRTAAQETRQVLGVPEVTVRVTMPDETDKDNVQEETQA